ncbi:MAG: 23S rRNA (uracil(1939)-C(5))-methyltransferase RlmD [Vampirovibrionales bacterium]|nr:23S rRNA (uracil(1939)-C(5))-methyltransferase RlmD [Vampirovibrionales bacterium]
MQKELAGQIVGESDGALLKVSIEKLVYGGDGLARISENELYPEKAGAVLFVPFSAPGDVLGVTPNFLKKPFKASISNIETASSDRITPECTVFGQCGGCDWQHLSLPSQRDWKRAIVAETLKRLGKLDTFAAEIVEPLLSKNEWRYRNKVQWQVLASGELAYLAEESHQTVAFGECLIIQPVLQSVAEILRQPEMSALLVAGKINKVTARNNQADHILLIFHTDLSEPDYPDCQALVSAFEKKAITLKGLMLEFSQNLHCLYGDDYLIETLLEKQYRVSAQSFFQVNPQAAELMLETLRQWLEIDPKAGVKRAQLLDVYGGVGTFAIELSEGFEEVMLVESSPTAVADAQKNFTAAGLEAAQIIEGKIELALASEDHVLKDLTPAVTLLDPPRRGSHPKVLEWVAANTSEAIVYISCDPTTLARDLKQLSSLGWTIQKIQPIDMFPQTYHIETLVMLGKTVIPAKAGISPVA